ncbi:BREX system ATP-binding protein BrxD [Dankookia rubra]|uniref:BREX system ATP-binding protein BrxD n=1 Tax=Dankookia rubra TaxID=1442381 RepID=A0A4R5QDB5_9PROT|nr:BREX system ATP-binding protein BrxD [Dankookia rubra]TDH61144.1 BREX system ATP-binding protein BrxD [Dankookia rubra]
MIGPQRRSAILDALRRGTVPREGLAAFAVGMERFEAAVDLDLAAVASGRGGFKAIRGEYGSGKTFFARWLQERARAAGFATAEVQVSETETPLHRWEAVYRRLVERLATSDIPDGALRPAVDAWFYTLEEDVLAESRIDAADGAALAAATEALMERRLAEIGRTAPAFSAVLRAYRRALLAEDAALAEGLIAWLGGQPNVAAAVKRAAGVKGDLDPFGAMHFLAGLLTILRDSGRAGLVLVLDEAETLQRMRADTREKGLNALRQLLDEIDAGRFPGLYLVVTGTAAFFEGPQGVQRLPPLAQRLHTDFGTDVRFDNPRAVQVRLQGFDLAALAAAGAKVRDLFADQAGDSGRLRSVVDDTYLADLAQGVAGRLGGKAGVAPRLYLRKLVADVLDRVDQFPDFDPRRHYAPTIDAREMSAAERAAAGAASVDDVELDT